MKQVEPINLSPSFLSKVFSKGYDYAVGEKIGLFKKDTKSMSAGRLFHELIAQKLGGDEAKIAISPYDSFRTNEAKNWRDSIPDDTTIVSEVQLYKLNQIVDRVINHPIIKSRLVDATPELMIQKKVNGFNIKGVLDVVSKVNGGTVIDWKFCSTKVFDKFKKEALYSHYDLQAAVYDFLAEPAHVYFVAIENEAPHRIQAFYCDESFKLSGADKFNQAVKIIKQADWRKPNFDIDVEGQLMSWDNF